MSSSRVTAQVVDEVASDIFDTQGILPATLLMLTGRVATLITKAVFQTAGKVAHTLLDITSHSVIALPFSFHVRALSLQTTSSLAIFIFRDRRRASSKLGSPGLHASASAGLNSVRLGHSTTGASSDNIGGTTWVSLGILKTEEFELRISNLTLKTAHIRCNLRNLVLVRLQLATERPTLGSAVQLAERGIGVGIEVILHTADTVHEALCLATVLAVKSIIILCPVLILEIDGVKHNLGLPNLLVQLLDRVILI